MAFPISTIPYMSRCGRLYLLRINYKLQICSLDGLQEPTVGPVIDADQDADAPDAAGLLTQEADEQLFLLQGQNLGVDLPAPTVPPSPPSTAPGSSANTRGSSDIRRAATAASAASAPATGLSTSPYRQQQQVVSVNDLLLGGSGGRTNRAQSSIQAQSQTERSSLSMHLDRDSQTSTVLGLDRASTFFSVMQTSTQIDRSSTKEARR